MYNAIIEQLLSGATPSVPELVSLLELTPGKDLDTLFSAAYQVKLRHTGNKIFLRGLIEFSNICRKNCYYCGIRRGNHKVKRYQISADEIVRQAMVADRMNLGSVVLQSGERSDPEFIDFVEDVLLRIKKESNGRLGITLSAGEQTEETYRRWFLAGAHRYLLRIETSDPVLYTKLHPADHSWQKRRDCLSLLSGIGYQTGTGVMLGMPFQTAEQIARDILFFQENNIDMIGMGPYIIHEDTPLAKEVKSFNPEKQLFLGLKTIAVTRLLLKDVNIASTTALQALHPEGRMKGLLAGANVIMPNFTETCRRENYQLYQGKPGISDDSSSCLNELKEEAANIGEKIAWGSWGDPLHFFARRKS